MSSDEDHLPVICRAVRTPVGAFGGGLRDVASPVLAATAIRGLVHGMEQVIGEVEDVVLGQCYPNGEAPAVGRLAALEAGLGPEVPGMQLDRRCGSGLQAVCYAATLVAGGYADVLVAGGTESMSQAEHYVTGLRWGVSGGSVELLDRLARSRVTSGGRLHPVSGGMIETAENLRRKYSISRQEQDELALRSHQRAVDAQDAGRFDAEIVPVAVPKSEAGQVIADEHPRRDTDLEQLARLRPVMHHVDPEATVTAGNASGQNDGAAVCLIASERAARELGLDILARVRAWAIAGVPPEIMGIGPVPATARALERAGLDLADMHLIELNEAFAAQVLAVTREWGFRDADFERLNVNGSGISLGHPVGATGARVLTTLLHELRRRGQELGLATLCTGGGQGISLIIEAVAA